VGQLKELGFDVRRRIALGTVPSVIVVDPDAWTRLSRAGVQYPHVILVGAADDAAVPPRTTDLTVLGPRPDPEAIYRALRDAAGKIDVAHPH
jgi:hypothetical protein